MFWFHHQYTDDNHIYQKLQVQVDIRINFLVESRKTRVEGVADVYFDPTWCILSDPRTNANIKCIIECCVIPYERKLRRKSNQSSFFSPPCCDTDWPMNSRLLTLSKNEHSSFWIIIQRIVVEIKYRYLIRGTIGTRVVYVGVKYRKGCK